jgi:hypothetical protein
MFSEGVSNACNSALITSIVSKWLETEKRNRGPSQASRMGGGESYVVPDHNFLVKKEL